MAAMAPAAIMQSAVRGGARAEGRGLLFKRVKVDTVNLQRGMFVALLDRPWLETPFLFQGFEIREDSELALLRKFCKHVYVDVERSSMPRELILEARNSLRRDHDPITRRRPVNGHAPRARSLQSRLLGAVARLDPSGRLSERLNARRVYENSVSTRQEAPRAVHAYGVAVDTMNEVLEDVRRGAGISVDKVKNAVVPMIDSVLRNQDALAWLVHLRKRDEYAFHHSIASSVWAVILGRHLGFERNGLQTLAMGGMLLDVGKVRIPASINEKDGPLSEAELEIMRRHVDYGLDLARKTPGINDDMLAMIASHHERHDGSGYPRGLGGTDIPVFGRISGLVDCYDAMTSHRRYAPAKSPYDAVRELNQTAGRLFQQELVEQFVQALGMFPTGSVVELNTGEIGIVIEQNRVRRLRPKVMLLLDANRQPLAARRTVDLKRMPSDESSHRACWIVAGHEAGAFGIDPKDFFL